MHWIQFALLRVSNWKKKNFRRGFIKHHIALLKRRTNTHKHALTEEEEEEEEDSRKHRMMMLSSRTSAGSSSFVRVVVVQYKNRRKGGKRITLKATPPGSIIPNNNTNDDENFDEGKHNYYDLAALERDLELQISLENYANAAKLRDEIKALKENDLVAVETCNATFYDAFRRGDWTTMDSKVWGRGDHVRCTHPGMPTVVGEENVRESWKIVFESMEGRNGGSRNTSREQQMDVQCKSVEAYANGNLGIVTCEEVVMRASTLTCTNVFEKQEGEWKMIQHHASAVFPGSTGSGGNNASSESSSESSSE